VGMRIVANRFQVGLAAARRSTSHESGSRPGWSAKRLECGGLPALLDPAPVKAGASSTHPKRFAIFGADQHSLVGFALADRLLRV